MYLPRLRPRLEQEAIGLRRPRCCGALTCHRARLRGWNRELSAPSGELAHSAPDGVGTLLPTCAP